MFGGSNPQFSESVNWLYHATIYEPPYFGWFNSGTLRFSAGKVPNLKVFWGTNLVKQQISVAETSILLNNTTISL